MKKDSILIRQLEVAYCVGVTETERAQPQRLLLSLDVRHCQKKAAESDDLAQTIDYHAICQKLLFLGEGRAWKLLETLASEIAQIVLDEFGADSVVVEIQKFIIPQAHSVGVRIERHREPETR